MPQAFVVEETVILIPDCQEVPWADRQNEFLFSLRCVSVSLGVGTNDTLLKGELKFGKGTVHRGEGRLNELIRDGAGSFVHDLAALLSSVFSVDFSFSPFLCVDG